MAPKSRDFHEILNFLESDQGASRTLLGYVGRVEECVRAFWNDFRASLEDQTNDENFDFFLIFARRQ